MAKNIIFIVCLFFSIYSEGLCNTTNSCEEMNNKTLVTIEKQDNDKEITVKPGDIIRIELEEMGSAGYSWVVDNLNTEYLEMLSKGTKPISEDKPGAPVLRIWMFKAKKKGFVEINMDHYRVWEGKEKATEHFSIKVLIK